MAERIALLDGAAPAAFAAFASLAEAADPEVERALARKLCSSDWRMRRAACEALGGAPRAPTTVAALFSRLDDPSPYVVAAACRALGALGGPALHDRLARVLERADEEARLAAVEALDAASGAEAFDVLVRVLGADPSERVRRRAGFAVRERASPQTWRAIFALWAIDPLPRHRSWACEIVGQYGDRACLPALAALADDANGHVRRAARRAASALRERPL